VPALERTLPALPAPIETGAETGLLPPLREKSPEFPLPSGKAESDGAARPEVPRGKGGILRILCADLLRLSIFLALCHAFVFQVSVVRGSSMMPNIHDGDRLFVDRVSYLLRDIRRFDVVILACPKEPGVDYVKRIVGLPGEEVRIREGALFVDGRRIRAPFPFISDPDSFGVWKVPEDSYFVLGDNRPVSSDSREGWFVRRDEIRGRVRACLWPLSSVHAF